MYLLFVLLILFVDLFNVSKRLIIYLCYLYLKTSRLHMYIQHNYHFRAFFSFSETAGVLQVMVHNV